eukprot:gene9504-4697_t
MHPISGMVGQWEIAAHVREQGRGGCRQCFLRNIQVGTMDSWDPAAAEDDIFGADPPNVQEWVAEERPFRGQGGCVPHFMQSGDALMSIGDWARTAGGRMRQGGTSVIIDS